MFTKLNAFMFLCLVAFANATVGSAADCMRGPGDDDRHVAPNNPGEDSRTVALGNPGDDD